MHKKENIEGALYHVLVQHNGMLNFAVWIFRIWYLLTGEGLQAHMPLMQFENLTFGSMILDLDIP
jgi:hypothetical protein